MAQKDGTKLVSFQKGSAEPGKKYSKFLKNNVVQISDTQSIDELERAIRTLIIKFTPVFQLLGPVLVDFKQYGVPENA
ncbi:hypothetical protein LZK73_11890 [Neorhizobium galegae]|nr:hypothetical protein LZK73_11890 [Neorhizobium galegae]